MRAALRRLFLEPEPPLVAVEVRSRSLGVVRASAGKQGLGVAAAASMDLAPGALRLSIAESNLADPTAFRATLRSACERAGVLAGARAALVLPDTVARVAVLPAAEVPARAADPEDLVRFRLRKSLPFEARTARIALRRDGDQVLAVAACPAVIDPYEAACRDCGLEPGQIELAGLALADAVTASRPAGDRLVVNWDDGYASLVLVRDGSMVLVRTLSGPGAESVEALRREIEATLLYHRERLGGQTVAGIALRAAPIPAGEAARALADGLDAPVEAVEMFARDQARVPLEALAGAAASLFRRVA